MDVFVVQHVHETAPDEEDVKFIGVYSTEDRAREAVERLSEKPGFRDMRQGFCIHRYPLDHDHWVEGYVSWSTALE